MKTQKRRSGYRKLFIPGFLFLWIVCMALSVQAADKNVHIAYKLRLSGKVDDAKALLEKLIKEDSLNAEAYFELARTQHHMMLGGAGIKSGEILSTIGKAVKYDPDNVIYAYYYANICFLNAYASKENTSNYVTRTCDAFKQVLKLRPDYKEAILTLVEIYGLLPSGMGGDKKVAEVYAKSLAGMDEFYFAKANSIVMIEDTNEISYWENLLEKYPESAKINEELGKVWFLNEDINKGAIYMGQAMALNPENRIPQLNIARAYIMMLMQNKGDREVNLELAETAFKKYIDISPQAINSYKAYSKGWIAKIKKFTGDEEGSKKTMAEAKALDPYFSMAFAVPPEYLYSPPDEISTYFSSYFNPF